jgi:hypothetical protein
MSDTSTYQLPVWAPRLSKLQIQRLYQSVGRDLLDEELVDDVGFSLYSRCISMLQVSEAIRGNPPCPRCDTTAQLDHEPVRFVRCANCGWMCPWELYQKTYQHKWLFAGGLEPFVKDYVRRFPATHSHRERMLLIDNLIHRFHWESEGVDDGRPGATSLSRPKSSRPVRSGAGNGAGMPGQVAKAKAPDIGRAFRALFRY